MELKGEAILAKVDSDASPQASSRFGIRSIPTLVLFRNGKEIKRQAGAVQAAQIVAWVRRPPVRQASVIPDGPAAALRTMPHQPRRQGEWQRSDSSAHRD